MELACIYFKVDGVTINNSNNYYNNNGLLTVCPYGCNGSSSATNQEGPLCFLLLLESCSQQNF